MVQLQAGRVGRRARDAPGFGGQAGGCDGAACQQRDALMVPLVLVEVECHTRASQLRPGRTWGSKIMSWMSVRACCPGGEEMRPHCVTDLWAPVGAGLARALSLNMS